MARPASRIAWILLALCHLAGVMAPCAALGRPGEAVAVHEHEHVLAEPSAPPCHGPGANARVWVQAVCPCGCGESGSVPAAQPTLGAALLAASLAWSPPPARSELVPTPARLPAAPRARIEHVPLAA